MKTTVTDGATVREEMGDVHTEYHVSGALDAVLRVVTSIFVNHHPHGYGTHLHALGMDDGGAYFARITRLTSCD